MKNTTKEISYWMPINVWNLNELFTTESISPYSFYSERDFGNPINRNHEKIEDQNNLILFDKAVQSDILLKISVKLLNTDILKEIKIKKKLKLKSFEYPKTIYLKNGLFSLFFKSREHLNEFFNKSFMLLEVKTVNKYKNEIQADESVFKNAQEAFYQSNLLTNKLEIQPFFDRAYNQIKGMIYGYCIGTIGTLGENEQGLVNDLSRLKNTIAGIHTDIVMMDVYTGFWLLNVRKQIKDCKKSFFDTIGEQSNGLDTLLLRLEEIDNLNKMRCTDLERQKSPFYRRDYETEQEKLEKARRELYAYERKHEILPLKDELLKIKNDEEKKGKSKGKTREYYKKDTYEYRRKQELKLLITELESDYEYQELRKVIEKQEEIVRNFQFGFTQFDSSISDQFSRISEYLHDIIKKSTNIFLNRNNAAIELPDVTFEIDIKKLASNYFNKSKDYKDYVLKFPKNIIGNASEIELNLLKVAVNGVLVRPQGQLGNISEQNVLEIMKNIGEQIPESFDKQILRDYYLYRVGKKDTFDFPANTVLANLIVFLMKLNGHEQINKMLISKKIEYKSIAFMLYGAYIGFSNLPKTFTNIIFESNNNKLVEYIDKYLFSNYIQDGI